VGLGTGLVAAVPYGLTITELKSGSGFVAVCVGALVGWVSLFLVAAGATAAGVAGEVGNG
jgi:hypothetical protein